ncbi:hypothetical protein [Aliiglaciecola sp. LCG003]|uniref:hypothetical protein n=1 Tax=Aliiglaciecola sp. LCG003 TaxID=3053655 RepID=UPI0025733BE3|nr:hypothetical protein [Aliiglaciecola sp. LCG003]WJG10682.1 hypothetical protein QR722_06465 [Aliiglaciecola sp. LCG003]
MLKNTIRKTPVALAIVAALLQGNALAAWESEHVFSIDDVMGSFDGTTYGTTGAATDPSIICGVADIACGDIGSYLDKSGVRLYPVDSEFGYYVVDFLGAEGKVRDYDYAEGFVGNEPDGGLRLSNAPTLKYKVKPPLGTWCQGLGGTSVKCETEHYTAMEHVLSCHETIPYKFADPVTGDQKILSSGNLTFDCANAPLDDNALILEAGTPGPRLISPIPCDSEGVPAGCQMFPNDKTDMLNNIALSTDYSVQLKDDGKPLYGWGGLHKRPNDVRMYARLALPDEWKEEDADFVVTKAYLEVDHLITNNPNDQIRPEDLENEAATGRKPSYRVEGTPGTADEVWKSTVDCYEGDGDFIEGETPASPIGIGTVLRNMPFALSKDDTPGTEPADAPYAFSSDLYNGLTNAYYTTINRDPFEWSYVSVNAQDTGVYDFVGTAFPKTQQEMEAEGVELVSGPRWRLKPNKFGQDLPGLEIPKIECSAPPFQKDNIKYEVGERVVTVINLLDWNNTLGASPLSTSKGWVDVNANAFVTVAGFTNGVPYTTNGLPMTEDFDVAFYVKGDSKSTAIYSAKLILEYEGQGPTPVPDDLDMELLSLAVPARATVNSAQILAVDIINNGPADGASGTVTVEGVSSRGEVLQFSDIFADMQSGQQQSFIFPWTAPSSPTTFTWTATVTADANDTNLGNDTATARTRVRR